jgi:hypothetical protein
MGGLITVDAYPDQGTESPSTAASAWKSALESWHKAWEAKRLNVSILVGEWGYSNTINVSDSTQEAVIKAETEAFATVPYLVGTNYWVGPGSSSDGGFTNIFVNSGGTWTERPAAADVSNFYAKQLGHVVSASPLGVPVPSSGWHVVYADAFGAQLGSGTGQDGTWSSGEKWNGCCTNSNEVAVEQHSQARVGSEGLELVCSVGSFTVEGVTRQASCGSVRTDNSTTPTRFEFAGSLVGEWAVECYCRWPVDTGGADPGWWIYPSSSSEIDFFEGWGWNGTSWATATGGIPVVVGQGETALSPVDSLGFDPSAAFHRYTTAFVPEGSGLYDVREYIDGVFRWDLPGRTLSSSSDGLILTNGLRVRVQPDVFTVRSIALWQDGAHIGQGVKGGGIAPRTTLAP